MALAAPQLLYSINGGAPTGLAAGATATIAPGVNLGLSLVSVVGVVTCTYTVRAPGTVLDGQSFLAMPTTFAQSINLPVTPTTYTITIAVTDGENVTAITVYFSATLSVATTDAWLYDSAVPAGISVPTFSQAQSTTGAGQVMRLYTQAAKVGSAANGGFLSFIHGYSDVGSGLNQTRFNGGFATAAPPAVVNESPSNYFGIWDLAFLGSGVSELALGLGTNLIGSGSAGVEIAAASEMNLATEIGGTPTSPINFQPAGGFGGQSFFGCNQDTSTGLPVFLIGTSPSNNFPAGPAAIGFSWMNGATSQVLVGQRNAGNTADLALISRNTNEIYWANGTDNSRFFVHDQFLITFGSASASAVVRFDNNAGVTALGVLNDGQSSVVEGTHIWPPTTGSRRKTRWVADTNTTTLQAILTVTITDNAVTTLIARIVARDSTNSNMATFEHKWSYTKSSGTISAGAGAQPAATDLNHSTPATGIAPQFAISSANIVLNVTPWTTNSTHWDVFLTEYVNTGTS